METYFDILPYELNVIIASKLGLKSLNIFKAIIGISDMDSFYRNMLIYKDNIKPKRKYNWEVIYETKRIVKYFEYLVKKNNAHGNNFRESISYTKLHSIIKILMQFNITPNLKE